MRIRKKPWAEEELAQNDHVMKKRRSPERQMAGIFWQ